MKRDAPVSEIMGKNFISLKVDDRLDFAEDIMQLGRIRHMPVLDGERLVGLVSQRDLLAASLSKTLDFGPQHRRAFLRAIDVVEVMSKNVVSVQPETSAREAALMMIRSKIGSLPVVTKEGALVGILTETDLLRVAYLEDDSTEDEATGGAA